MSYCVNCGVELEAAQKKCPLCSVKVVNPADTQPQQQPKTFPVQKDELKKKDRVFWINFITILLAVPIITCVLSNLLVGYKLTWSIYVIGGVFMLWVFSTSPFWFRKFNSKKMLLADMAAIIIGLFLIETQAPGKGWVVVVALPTVLYSFASWLLIIHIAKIRATGSLDIAAAFFVSIAIMLPGFEALLDVYFQQTVSLIWSWFIIAPCLSVAALLIILNRNKRFKQEMSKRLHF